MEPIDPLDDFLLTLDRHLNLVDGLDVISLQADPKAVSNHYAAVKQIQLEKINLLSAELQFLIEDPEERAFYRLDYDKQVRFYDQYSSLHLLSSILAIHPDHTMAHRKNKMRLEKTFLLVKHWSNMLHTHENNKRKREKEEEIPRRPLRQKSIHEAFSK